MVFDTIVDTATLAAHLDDPHWVIVDCRHDLGDVERGERAYRASHIPGAFFMHLDRDLAGEKTGVNGRHPLPDVAVLARKLGTMGIADDTQVVAYDDAGGVWASRFWWQLRALGHRAVAVLDGGLARWTREGRALDAALPRPRQATFSVRATPQVANAGEILAQLEASRHTIVDARSAERFRGEKEPIDPVAGHVPGARNRPHTANLTGEGTFKDAATLRHEFLALLGDTAAASIIHQCGSGVTACHNLLAMEVAGLRGSRLYPGSWSEWSADPHRPIARGD